MVTGVMVIAAVAMVAGLIVWAALIAVQQGVVGKRDETEHTIPIKLTNNVQVSSNPVHR